MPLCYSLHPLHPIVRVPARDVAHGGASQCSSEGQSRSSGLPSPLWTDLRLHVLAGGELQLRVAVSIAVAGEVSSPGGPAAGTGRFGYLFPTLQDRPDCLLPYRADGSPEPGIQSLLKDLAREMESPAPTDEDSRIPAGVTYLGQFIVHDVSFDGTSSVNRRIDPYAVENLRAPGLRLESLYGRGPLVQPYLYERLEGRESAGARLLLGHRLNSSDLPRDTAGRVTGRALIGDPRNDDNPIVSQLHLAFAAFHNAVADRLAPGISDPYELFVAASTLVRQHFQWIILNDFLRTVADPAIVDAVIASPCNELCRPGGAYVPVEFSMGAFRFGHSMVRPFYTMAEGKTAALDQMRREFTFRNPLTAGVPVAWGVDWTRFFWAPGARPLGANVARRIDTHVTPGLPTETTLLRAYAARVPSGQCVAAALQVPRLTDDDLRAGHAGGVVEQQAGLLIKRTPLWYYVLREAEVVGRGERLGPLGSRVVAEVLVNLLRADAQSILGTTGWTPTLGSRRGEFRMLDLLCLGGRVSPCLP
jgi:Animal haem peroxidase